MITKRDFVALIVTPAVLLLLAMDLLWLAGRLDQSAERRSADYAILQERSLALPTGSESALKSPQRAASTLSRLVVEAHEADITTAKASTSLAVVLLAVSLFQILTAVRLFRNQRKLTVVRRTDIAGINPPVRPANVGAGRPT